ncbi:MAG: PEP-CTERM sorting domain-containing protein [Opitutus sp.]|nr:PEP-CTERM sorting domain-containing protein [Opitutus sp.]
MNCGTPRKLFRFGISVGLFLTAHCLSHAQAVITWGTPTFISGDADVAVVDTRIWAYNFGDASKSPVVNGVTFTGYASNTGNSDFTLTTVGSSIYHQKTVFGNAGDFFTSLSSDYQDLLRSATYWSGQTIHTQTMTLENLVVGTTYQIQFWVNDSRTAGYHNDEVVSFADTFDNSVDVRYSNNGATLGQYVIGTFTAEETTQIIHLGPYSPQINAATLGTVAIPEPSTYAVLVGVLALGLVVLCRRK